MAKDGILMPGPQAWATLTIFGFIKMINQPGETLRARAERMHTLWALIRENADARIVRENGNIVKGDPKVEIVDQAWQNFRDEYDVHVDTDPNWQDLENRLAKSLDKILYLMTEVVVDNKIMEKARFTGPMDLEKETLK
ncbi:MAG: hypothetical protein A4E28_00008 [Methanocella sp. PtaU1.Bin125]|nr:MAG: hypothetical protein A4E28_00008 [Methanocella sp. PtaU1.Bin125]